MGLSAVASDRINNILGRETESISIANELLAHIFFHNAELGRQAASFTRSAGWELQTGSGINLRSVAVEQIHIMAPGPVETNCWDTAFYLAGLSSCEGEQLKQDPKKFIEQKEAASYLVRVPSIGEADLVVNGSIQNPKYPIHAALMIDYELVHDYLECLERMKELCSRQLRLTVKPNEITRCDDRVLIERFAGSGSDSNERNFNYTIEASMLRKFPMFYQLIS